MSGRNRHNPWFATPSQAQIDHAERMRRFYEKAEVTEPGAVFAMEFSGFGGEATTYRANELTRLKIERDMIARQHKTMNRRFFAMREYATKLRTAALPTNGCTCATCRRVADFQNAPESIAADRFFMKVWMEPHTYILHPTEYEHLRKNKWPAK